MLATFEGYELNIKNVKITSNIKYETQADDISKKRRRIHLLKNNKIHG